MNKDHKVLIPADDYVNFMDQTEIIRVLEHRLSLVNEPKSSNESLISDLKNNEEYFNHWVTGISEHIDQSIEIVNRIELINTVLTKEETKSLLLKAAIRTGAENFLNSLIYNNETESRLPQREASCSTRDY